MDIINTIHDKRFFAGLFKDPKTWYAWEVYLKALFGLPITDKKEKRLFRSCTGLRSQPGKRPRESFVICGRRSGKSFISSIIAVYLATFKDWSKTLNPGERGYIFIIANDKAQARIIKNYVSGILNQSAHFQKLVSKDLAWEIELHNQVTIAIKTCNFRSVRGYTLICCIAEEIAFWRSEDSANPDREILTAVRPALATIPESLLIGISTPYSRSGILYESWKKYHGKFGGPLIWKAATERMNPTIDRALIKSALEDDPSAARAEWEAEFRMDIEAFMPLEFIESVIIPGRFELPKVEGISYYGYLDPSGGRQDSMTLAIAHKEKEGRIILDALRETRPPFAPSSVVAEYSDLLKTYKIKEIESDRYAAEWVSEAFRNHGIEVKNSDLSSSELYLSLLPLIANKTVDLLDNKRLRTQLSGLERKTRSGGKDLVSHGPGAHDDLALATAGACVMANSEYDGPSIIIADYEMTEAGIQVFNIEKYGRHGRIIEDSESNNPPENFRGRKLQSVTTADIDVSENRGKPDDNK